MTQRFWTGVGSRETPDSILLLMTFIARTLTDLGWVMRSGGAGGADSAFYAGCLESKNFPRATPEVYLSWNGMTNGKEKLYHDPAKGLFDAQRYSTWDQANAIALATRGSFEGLGRGGIAHHTRNVFQVLGVDLQTPAAFLICWAIPVGKTGKVKGGTNTAVKLALANGIKVINLYHPDQYNAMIDFLDKHEVEHAFPKKEV